MAERQSDLITTRVGWVTAGKYLVHPLLGVVAERIDTPEEQVEVTRVHAQASLGLARANEEFSKLPV